jgi:hypothetical protein
LFSEVAPLKEELIDGSRLKVPGAPRMQSKAKHGKSIIAHSTKGSEKEFYSVGALAVRGVEGEGVLEKKYSEKSERVADALGEDSGGTFVTLLANRAKERLQTIDKLSAPDEAFVSQVKINLDLREYVRRLTAAAKLPAECLPIAAFYVEKMTSRGDLHIVQSNIHGICLCSMMMASKMYEDIPYANSYWSALSGTYPIKQLNRMEITLLDLLDFQLNVTDLTFRNYAKMVGVAVAAIEEI